LVCSVILFRGGDSAEKNEQYVLHSFRIAPAKIQKDFDNKSFFLIFFDKSLKKNEETLVKSNTKNRQKSGNLPICDFLKTQTSMSN